ncbi:MAG TPA: hypothetical protein VK009_14975 [Chloroflexota bacterium]|nr:hypothetical protein [Chloroflexota bacterium]
MSVPNIELTVFMTLPFLLSGMSAMALPYPPVIRYFQVIASSGMCLLVVALLRHAGIL